MGFAFEMPFSVNSHDCGMTGLLRPSGYLRYMQEAANLNVEHVGFGYDDCLSRGCAFVISRLSLDIFKPLRAYENAVARTSPAESKGVSFSRSSSLFKDGNEVARMNSIWALLHLEDRTLVRVSDSGLVLPLSPLPQTSAPLVFRIPKDTPLSPLGEFRVLPSHCDRNRHMNNTRYPDMFCDFLPDREELQARTPAELSIAFHGEAPVGDTLTVYGTELPCEDQSVVFLMRAVRSDSKLCSEARLRFEPKQG